MSAEKIITDLQKKKFKPIYWLEGEESYFIDEIMTYAEHNILSESEAGFNLSIFYGKDANWADIINACKRYPMFAEYQVVLLKEAQQMKDIEKLESYIENPLPSTLFFVSHKEKKIDGRSKLAKILKTKGEHFITKKLYDNQIPDWVTHLLQQQGLSIQQKALLLLVEHVGNDLSRLQNEIEKLTVNLHGRKNITEDDIEKYIGVSKEYNVFELQEALGKKNLAKAIKINQYFASNPKAAPIQLLLPALYNYFSKVYMIFGVQSTDEKQIAAATGLSPFFVKDYIQAAKLYGQQGIEKVLLLLHQYNLRVVGVEDAGTEHADLIKELSVKMML
ncbi:MAG: DNA polymerase III subunit delta [Chitinophagaceae bacterium]